MTVTAVVAEDTTAVHRIPTADAMKAVKFKIQPEYPAIARQLRVGGTVDVDVLINSTGEVDKVTLLDGDALLAKSVISAVKKWKFILTAAGTGPPPIVARLTFRFEP